MEFFKKYFDEVDNWNNEEVKVLCPFHEDTHPSASINTYKDLFHCWVCDIGYNEEQFIARVNNKHINPIFQLIIKIIPKLVATPFPPLNPYSYFVNFSFHHICYWL